MSDSHATKGSKLPVQSSPKITKVEKSEKIKDPRKVEAGKRLAVISREAKKRKARKRSAVVKSEQREISDYIDYRYFIGGVGVVAAVGGLYFAYKRDNREEKVVKMVNEEPTKCVVKHENKKLDSFD